MKLFISYARPDASNLASNINDYYSNRLSGYEVFLDTAKISGGVDWENKIIEEIQSSEIVIALITEAAFTSKYIANEIKTAIKKQKYIIPCLRQNVDIAKLKDLGLAKEQVIIFNDQEMDKLYGKINDAIASYKRNPYKVKEYQEKRRKEKRRKLIILIIIATLSILISLILVEIKNGEPINYQFNSKFGSYGFDKGKFVSPSEIAIDSDDNLYVADTDNHRIQKFDNSGNYLTSWSHRNSTDQFYPEGITIDLDGNVYVADPRNTQIQKFDNSGNYLTSWGIRK